MQMQRDRGSVRDLQRRVAAVLFAALAAVAAACTPAAGPVQIGSPAFAGGLARFEIVLGPDLVPGSLVVTLDGAAVTDAFSVTGRGVTGSVAVADGAAATLVASARFLRSGQEEAHADTRTFTAPVRTPALVSSAPAAGAADVLRTEWLRLEFASAAPAAALQTLRLDCAGSVWAEHPVTAHALSPAVVVVNPVGDLPSGAQCGLSWQGPTGPELLLFETAAAGAHAEVHYDRTQERSAVPYPDDLYTVADASTATGLRLAVPAPGGPTDVTFLFGTLLPETNRLDGFSPIAHFTLEVSDAPDASSLPQTPAESLDPLASIALLDLSAGAGFGHRVPFRIEIRNDTSALGVVSHSLLVFPSIPLTPGGRFGLVVTRRARVDAGRPLDPSSFFAAALAPAQAGEDSRVTQVRALAGDVLAAAAAASPPIAADDVALALRVSIRSTDTVPNDLLAIKSQVLGAAPPTWTIKKVTAETSPTSQVAAIVEGTWQAPDWRANGFLVRDAGGAPVQQATRSVPFILALPKAALTHPVPITMYQHGNPGSSEREVPSHARKTLAGAGFAVVGFTDPLNREIAPNETDPVAKITAQVYAIFLPLTQFQRIPDYWVETNAEQLAFVRMLSTLGTLDVLPVGAPDGIPDLDPTLPLTYVGISEGANHGPGLLPYAPEIKAAALVAGGRRFTEVMIHQQADVVLSQIGGFFQSLTPAEIWAALSLFQGMFDVQDEHNHARFLYRDPFTIAGTTQRASLLVVEGLDDSLVPNHATDSFAWEVGPIPHLLPVQRPIPFLTTATGPLIGNVDAQTTAALFQYVPTGVPGVPPTPGCAVLAPSSGSEGHYCAQSAAESLHQREVFFQSALTGVPRIIDPFSE